MKTQRNRILTWMRSRPITAMSAFDSLGIINLSGRIAELRNDGYKIENHWAEAPNRHGETTRFVRYVLVEEPKKAA